MAKVIPKPMAGPDSPIYQSGIRFGRTADIKTYRHHQATPMNSIRRLQSKWTKFVELEYQRL